MKKKLVLVTSVLVVCVLIFNLFTSDDVLDEAIVWNKGIMIKLEDYEAPIDENSNYNIYYYHGFYLKGKVLKTAHSKSVFDKSKSWVKDTVNFNFKLENEIQQIRFDLHEVYSRKFNIRIEEMKYKENTKFSDLYLIGDSLNKEIKVISDSITESDIPINERIKTWRPKINTMLRNSLTTI